ncbi:hypothetical protein As57867_003777, partial [Aphanomyces stellatus]
LQLVLSLGALGLVASDFVVTVEGLKGFLMRKPVMTFDLLAGLERRKLLLLMVSLGALPSMLYADVSRIYYGTTNGNLIWYLSTILIGIFIAFSTLLGLTFVQTLPCPWPNHLVTFSPALFSYGTIISMVIVWNNQYVNVALAFNNAPFLLAFNVSGTFQPSGAYTSAGIDTVMNLMIQRTYKTMGICLAISIGFATLRRKIYFGTLLVDVGWTRTNSFLSGCGTPHWLTGLPLESQNAIKIGNKLYCKPSTQAVMGFAVVVDHVAETHQVAAGGAPIGRRPSVQLSDLNMALVNVYVLVPALWRIFRWLPATTTPCLYGTVDKNTFTRSNQHIGGATFHHHRGMCVN